MAIAALAPLQHVSVGETLIQLSDCLLAAVKQFVGGREDCGDVDSVYVLYGESITPESD